MQNTNPYEDLYMARMHGSTGFQVLLETYRSLVQVVVRGCLKHAPSGSFYAEDLIEEGYMCVHQALWTYREDQNTAFRTYLCLLIRRITWNELRHYDAMEECAPHRIYLYQDDESDEAGVYENRFASSNPMHDPAYSCRYRQAERNLNRAMARLTDREKEVYRAVCAGEKRKQTAERLGCSLKSYDGCLSRIHRKARRAVTESA